jgi:hypothetical protein
MEMNDLLLITILLIIAVYAMTLKKSGFSAKAQIIDQSRSQINNPQFKFTDFRRLVGQDSDGVQYASTKALLKNNPGATIAEIDSELA